jgi:hypothetical protein
VQRIYNQIAKADLVVADMTGQNPNVSYETGYAHALGKQVILLTKKTEDIPFDLKHYPHIVYSGIIRKLKDDLEKRVRSHLANKAIQTPTLSNLKFFIGQQEVKSGSVVDLHYVSPLTDYSQFEIAITVHNTSAFARDLSHMEFYLVLPGALNTFGAGIALPDGRAMLPLKSPSNLRMIPDGWKLLQTFVYAQSLDASARAAIDRLQNSVQPCELQAISELETLRIEFQLSIYTFFEYGVACFMSGRHQEAVDSLLRIPELGGNPQAFHLMAFTHLKLGARAEAERYMEIAARYVDFEQTPTQPRFKWLSEDDEFYLLWGAHLEKRP